VIDTRPVRYRQLTPDEVLAELRLYFRDWGVSDVELAKYVCPEASLLELAKREPEADWADLISHHGLSLPDDEWFATLKPEHTVRDFCEAVADLNEVPILEPATVLGTRCETAGAFRALKRMLADYGADVSELRPSSEVKPYLDARPDVFHRFRLATSGRLPPYSRQRPWPCLVVLVSILAAIGAWWLKYETGIVVALAVGAVFGLIAFLYPPRYSPTDSDGHQLTTFRDLIHAALARPRRVMVAG
jgi:hypothetical protein